jgi:hypothetical protein
MCGASKDLDSGFKWLSRAARQVPETAVPCWPVRHLCDDLAISTYFFTDRLAGRRVMSHVTCHMYILCIHV